MPAVRVGDRWGDNGAVAAELIYEIWCSGADTDAPIELPGDPPVIATATPWLRWSLTDTEPGPQYPNTVELGLAGPRPGGRPPAAPVPVLRSWPRGSDFTGDAQLVLAWLHGNALADRAGIDTDMLVQLFIEAAVDGSAGVKVCDGEYLSTIAGISHRVGTTAGARWRLQASLPAALRAAVLDAIAGSGPQWRYAIVAAQDPDSPAGRVRRLLLEDLSR